jgi:hypothetical protein
MTRFDAPAHYRLWWESVEGCSGRRKDLDGVAWYRTFGGAPIVVGGQSFAGYWFGNPDRIVVSSSTDEYLVRHEMLHALLDDGAHSPEFFGARCGGVVGFDLLHTGGIGSADTIGAVTLDADNAFSVGVSLFVPSRALLAYDRLLLHRVTIANRGSAGWMNVADGWIFELREVDRSNAFGALYPTGLKRLFWRVGEVRTYAVTLKAPPADSMRVSVFLGRQRDTLVFRLR